MLQIVAEPRPGASFVDVDEPWPPADDHPFHQVRHKKPVGFSRAGVPRQQGCEGHLAVGVPRLEQAARAFASSSKRKVVAAPGPTRA